MNTPIRDFLEDYSRKAPVRLHMPGHKGSLDRSDITEIAGADVLYSPRGIIRQSEENAARLFGSARTVYSAQGTTLSICAMLFLAAEEAKRAGKKPLIAAARNVHRSFVSAAALIGFDVDWIYGEEERDLLSGRVSVDGIASYLDTKKEKPIAFYLTSPDYLGNIADIAGISRICREKDVLLLVDNAHGAYLRFLPESIHPLDLGADLCCDSAHKTLPALTGAGYLHIAKAAPAWMSDRADAAMALFASTSPSYPILSSIDAVNSVLASSFRAELAKTVLPVAELRSRLKKAGYEISSDEPLKLTVLPKSYGYTGSFLAEYLEKRGFVSEFADADHLVWMFGTGIAEEDIRRLGDEMVSLEKKEPIPTRPPRVVSARRALTIREAVFSAKEKIPVSKAEGRIFADAAFSCPPAVPAAIAGEIVTANTIETMEYYGIKDCFAVL